MRKITDTRADEEASDKKPELKITGVILKDGTKMDADAVIVATGGLSYPSTGSTGDGYKMAEDAGHTVTECTPSLVPFNVKEEWVKSLQGDFHLKIRLFPYIVAKRSCMRILERCFYAFRGQRPYDFVCECIN